jgi:Holliday junction resolvasome RuvABC ATP-dependent DNA helicase subunit
MTRPVQRFAGRVMLGILLFASSLPARAAQFTIDQLMNALANTKHGAATFTEQKYIAILKDGPQRLNVIASLIGLPSRTVSQVSEPFLIRAGLVVKDDQGKRMLTAAGYEHAAQTAATG